MSPIAIAEHAMIIPGLLDWSALRDGVSAITNLPETMPVAMGGPVPLEFTQEDDAFWPSPMMPRALSLARAALQALPRDPDRSYGLVLGLPNLFSETAYMEHTLLHRANPKAMELASVFSYDFPMNFLAGVLKNCGPRVRVDSACATGNDALITAWQWLASGVVDDVVVVSASAMLNPVGLALFHNLKALNDKRDPQASCPFDIRRRGFVMGEGAAAVWMTNHPPQKPKGYLCGYGQSLNAEKFVDLPQDITPMVNACRSAMGNVKEVAYVSAHGTATQANDLKETQLHHQLFGKAAPFTPLSSIKSMIGHCLGASALIEAIVCLEALREQIAPPTINLHEPDPVCDLDYVPNQARPISGNFALSNAFAFGGQNASVLFSGEKP